MNVEIIGITGTRQKLTTWQHEELERMLRASPPRELHHGDCVGGDLAAHRIAAKILGVLIVVHPPIITTMRAFCQGHVILPKREYRERNRDIGDICHRLIALPLRATEERRSGTWQTVRYVRRLGKPITLILPDGTVTNEGATGNGTIKIPHGSAAGEIR